MAEPITWQEIRDQVAQLHQDLQGARDRARSAVLTPAPGMTGNQVYVDAFAAQHFEVEGMHDRAEQLVERLAEAAPPARPLEAVLADIVAEGHIDIDLSRYPISDMWRIRSHSHTEPCPRDTSDREAWAAWRENVEHGEGDGTTATAAAEARLAQIRELHREKIEAIHAIAAMCPSRWTVREKAFEFESYPWYVEGIDVQGRQRCWHHDDEDAARTAAAPANELDLLERARKRANVPACLGPVPTNDELDVARLEAEASQREAAASENTSEESNA